MKLSNEEMDIVLEFCDKLKELVKETNSRIPISKKPVGKGKTEILLTGKLVNSDGIVQEGIKIDCKGWDPFAY